MRRHRLNLAPEIHVIVVWELRNGKTRRKRNDLGDLGKNVGKRPTETFQSRKKKANKRTSERKKRKEKMCRDDDERKEKEKSRKKKKRRKNFLK